MRKELEFYVPQASEWEIARPITHIGDNACIYCCALSSHADRRKKWERKDQSGTQKKKNAEFDNTLSHFRRAYVCTLRNKSDTALFCRYIFSCHLEVRKVLKTYQQKNGVADVDDPMIHTHFEVIILASATCENNEYTRKYSAVNWIPVWPKKKIQISSTGGKNDQKQLKHDILSMWTMSNLFFRVANIRLTPHLGNEIIKTTSARAINATYQTRFILPSTNLLWVWPFWSETNG